MRDYLFVIKPTTNLEELEKQKNEYDSLPYDQRRHSDDECIRIYGVNNETLYTVLLSYIQDKEEDDKEREFETDIDSIVSEAFEMSKQETPREVFYNKIEAAKKSEENNGIVLIFPYNIEYDYVYTMEDLNNKYSKFLALSSNLKKIANEESTRLFGYNVLNMYDICKVAILSNIDTDSFEKSPITTYTDMIKVEESDCIVRCLRKLDLINIQENGSIYESAIAEQVIPNLVDTERLSDNMPQIVPYLTPDEIINYTGDYTEFIDDYKAACATGLCDYSYADAYSKVNDLCNKLTVCADSEKEIIENQIISLGWNPSVKPSPLALKIARGRIKNYIDENYNIEIVDVSHMIVKEDSDIDIINEGKLYPIYIVLSYTETPIGKVIRKVQKSTYSHAAIAFEPDLKHLYSFNMANEKHGGLSFESIDQYKEKSDNGIIKVLAIFVTENQKARVHARLDYYIANMKKTKYDIKNLFRILLNKKNEQPYSLKMVCSQFVDNVLRAVNIDLTGKPNNLVSPDDLDKVHNSKVYLMYEGLIKNYNTKVTDTLSKAISLNRSATYKMIELKEAVDLLYNNRDILLYKAIKTNNEDANIVLDELAYYLTADSVLIESKKFPFSFSNKGDLEINFPTKIEEEYQKSHKLLLSYDETNNYEGIKSELANLWSLNNIAEKKLNGKFSSESEKKRVIKTRARILNDFKKYLGKVLNKEKEFNFAKYFNNSPYYDGSVSIDATTLKWSGRLIKSLIVPN